MARSKVVYNDQGVTKRFDGEIDLSDPNLVKIIVDDGRTIYVNKANILFIKELP